MMVRNCTTLDATGRDCGADRLLSTEKAPSPSSHHNSTSAKVKKQRPVPQPTLWERLVASPPPSKRRAIQAPAESLVLGSEEAFFLHNNLHCLEVHDGEHVLTTEELWMRLGSTFPDRFAVYAHCRARGWVPRDGVKVGVHFTLYRRGPAFEHAPFSLVVVPGFLDDLSSSTPVSWRTMLGTNRVAEQVHKGLVFAWALRPRGLDLSSPSCLSSYVIQFIFQRRLIPDRIKLHADFTITGKPTAKITRKTVRSFNGKKEEKAEEVEIEPEDLEQLFANDDVVYDIESD